MAIEFFSGGSTIPNDKVAFMQAFNEQCRVRRESFESLLRLSLRSTSVVAGLGIGGVAYAIAKGDIADAMLVFIAATFSSVLTGVIPTVVRETSLVLSEDQPLVPLPRINLPLRNPFKKRT